ncbi:MAG: hypothetical protein ACE5GJ_11165 [Gemmatimonadota bacterium]
MPRTFEEIAGEELDGLYHGSLFLCGGDESRAEELLIAAIRRASASFADAPRRDGAPQRRWLEGLMVDTFLRSAPAPRPRVLGGRVPGREREAALAEVTPRRLYHGAGRVPPRARGALWLVLVRRWRYTDVADALGVRPHALQDLLAYRDVVLSALLNGGGRRAAGEIQEM